MAIITIQQLLMHMILVSALLLLHFLSSLSLSLSSANAPRAHGHYAKAYG